MKVLLQAISIVKELNIRIVVEEKFLLQTLEALQESDHSSLMVCDEIYIYKQQEIEQSPLNLRKKKPAA